MSSTDYKYTYDSTYLTAQQRDYYEENGFIVFRKLINDDIVDECKQRFREYCNGEIQSRKVFLAKDSFLKGKGVKGEYVVNKLQNITLDDVFFKLACYEPLVNVLQSIIGPNITNCHCMGINKPPNSEKDLSVHPLHQDFYYFPFDSPHRMVTAWMALERSHEQNGCLFVIPGSHKGSLYDHNYTTSIKNKAYYGVSGFDDATKVELVMEKGDVVFFHPLLLHGSGQNLTEGFRKAIIYQYVDSNVNFVDVSGTNREFSKKEITDMFIRLGLPPLKYEDIWRYKSKLVRGSPGNLQNSNYTE